MKANLKKMLGMTTLGMSLMVGTVQADSLLASGPVFGGPTQNHVACQVFNAGQRSDHLRQYPDLEPISDLCPLDLQQLWHGAGSEPHLYLPSGGKQPSVFLQSPHR